MCDLLFNKLSYKFNTKPMNYIEEHSFSDHYPSSELSLEQYIPDQSVELYPNGSMKFSVS